MKNKELINTENQDNLEPTQTDKKYTSHKRKSTLFITAFALSVVLLWVDYSIAVLSWLNFYDKLFRITDILLLVFFICMFAFGILTAVFYLRKPMNKEKGFTAKAVLLIAGLAVIIGLHSFWLTHLADIGYQAGAVTNIMSKDIGSGNKPYFVILGTDGKTQLKMECDKEEYDELIVDENVLYSMEYRTIVFDKNKGILDTIDIREYVDNRNK